MANCTVGSIRITTAKEQKTNEDFTKSLISSVTSRDVADIIAHDINTGAFYNYFASDAEFSEKAKGSIFNLNRNTFKKYARIYERAVYPGVTAFIFKGQVNTKRNFDSFDSKNLALRYTGDLIVEAYNELAFSKGLTKLKGKQVASSIRKYVQNTVLKNLISRALNSAEQKNNKKAYEAIEKIAEEISYYDKGITAARRGLIEAKKGSNADEINKWGKRYQGVINAKDAKIEELLVATNKLFKEDIDSIENQNYWALANELFAFNEENKENKEPYYVDWFKQVSYLPKVFEVKEAFRDIYEHNKINDIKEYDDYNIESLMNEDELFSFDASTANWSDSSYNNYLQHYDNRLKLYLNSLYKLKTTTKLPDGQYEYQTNNRLGVPETMGAGFIIAQLVAFGDFSSVNAFIKSVKGIAENIPGLAGLIKLVNDMEADRSFANMVASNLAKPAIIKNMLIFDGENFNIVHSNQNAYNSTQIFNRLMAISKITVTTDYDQSVNDTAQSYIRELDKINNAKDFVDLRIKIGDFILGYFKKYFAGINPDIITNYYYTFDETQKINRAKRLLEIIDSYNSQIDKVKSSINKESERVRRINEAKKKEIAINIGEENWKRIPLSSNQKTQFNPEAVDYSPIVSAVGQLARLLSGQMPANIELNSGNAENNMSSDITKNSYLTNFLNQLNYIIENPDGSENQKGVELLKDFLTKKGDGKATSYYEYSTILFGIRNPLWKEGSRQPKYLREGLFINDKGQILINPNAKNIINIAMVNGAKNTNVRVGQLYQDMSGSDYFTYIVNSYFSPINYNREYGDGSNNAVADYCQVLLRIPSDASNQYSVQMPKYNTKGLYVYDENSTKEFIEEKLVKPYTSLKGVHDNFIKKVANNLYDEFKLNAIFKGKTKNFINAEQAAQILYDGGIKDSISLYGYYSENNGKTLPLLVQGANNSFIIYLETKEATWKSGKDYKIVGISSVDGTRVEKVDPLLMDKYTEIKFTPINEAIRNFFITHIDTTNEFAFDKGYTKRQYNKNSVVYQGFKTQLLGEFNTFFNAISDLFESVQDDEGRIHYVTKKDTKHLFEYYHYNPKKGIIENGRLTGFVFNFNKLFTINGYNAGEELLSTLNLYGENGLFKEYGDGQLELNLERVDLINKDLTGNLDSLINGTYKESIENILSQWLDKYAQYIKEESAKYSIINQRYSQNEIYEAVVNQTLAYMEFDDLFEGSSKYYSDAQTFLKRDKEVQAGGQLYAGGVDLSDDLGAPIHDLNDSNGEPIEISIKDKTGSKTSVKTKNFVDGNIVDGTLIARNGFRAVTIYNTNTTFDVAKDIYEKTKKRLIEVEGLNKENAEAIAKNIADGYGFSGTKTKVNDAQSYITIEEFIRRKWMDGTLSEYKDLLSKVLDENYKLTEQDYADINRKIQVQKNFYYDIAFDKKTGLYYPRQIKNAEFVLIPRFIKGSDLEHLYDIMRNKDINQINTIETSKAANINTLEYWDNNGEAHVDKFKEALDNTPESIQTYYYRYLYKQQDVVDHIDDEENKAGIQILKKIQDNILNNPNASQKAKDAVNTIQNNLTKNIEKDFNNLMKSCGWHINDASFLVNDEGQQDIKFDEFYRKARNEASRLGMDSNFLDYVTPNADGVVAMPTFMNNVSSKLESIAQSVFNNSIVRQKLPGFHAVQVTNVGYSRKLNYNVTDEGAVCEIMVAPWSSQIKQMIDKYGEKKTLEKLAEIGADEFVGYRIPTEGKQSIIKMKVVGFLNPTQGSTIIVPNEWVAQTGSDFDIDTIYSIVHELAIEEKNVSSKKKVIRKTPEGKDFEDEETIWTKEDTFVINNKGRAKRNNEILEAFKTILSDPAAFEENMSRSNFDDISDAIDKYNPIDKNASVYDVFTEVRFMQNAIAGRKLKAFSVNRDTFNSISNAVHGIIKDSGIRVIYDLSKINKENLDSAYGTQVSYFDKSFNKVTDIDDINQVLSNKITYIPYRRTGDIINSVSKGTNICLGTQILCIEMINDAFNNGDIQHNVKTWPISIWAKSPVTEDNIAHYTTLVNINDKYYIFDMPQSEFIIPTGNTFVENGEIHKEAEIKEYKPRLIPLTKDSLQTLFGSTEEHATQDINQLNDLLNELNNKNTFKINLDIASNKNIQKKYAIVEHNRIGWSNNNRNIVGKLITPYSSQTTAHILDAIKKGTIFNETDYTFGSFKTLIDLGIDYDTAVSFLAQQAITDLNDEYFKVNSVFNNTYPTIIENVYRRFAQQQGFTYNGAVIGDNAPFKVVMKAIASNEDFVQKYLSYWNINDINEIPALSEEKFANALKSDEINPYHYFGVLQIFNNLKQKTDIIEDIAQCSRPDATGAKQTVRATRKMLDDIRTYATDKEHSVLIGESGNQFLVDLYGLTSDGKVDLEKSKYKYLAAILKYGVETSVTANKRLFLFAGDKFDSLTKFIETRIGKDLTDDEFNSFKKYYVSSLYAGLEFISSPVILDKNQDIISNPDYSVYGPSFWDTERSRVFGYIEPAENGDTFGVKDFNKPTEEEIKKYLLLTPLQKVMFLKEQLSYDDNIFNKLYISKTSDKNYKEKGYTNNKISINIDNLNIETIYQQFRDAFFSENPLIRLAAIDLVKYTLLVEGFNYKNGCISKIIPNQVLLGEVNDRAFNIISTLNDDFVSRLADENEYADKFIRSHPELIRSVSIPKPSAKEGQTTLGDVLNRYREKIEVMKQQGSSYVKGIEESGYISIPVEETTKDLRNALKLNNNQISPKYIKINSTSESSGKQIATLYKVIPITAFDEELDKEIPTKFNLIPLNLLEENEWADVSVNNNNNKFYNYGFYIAMHPENKLAKDIVTPIILRDNVIDASANKTEPYVRKINETENTDNIENLVNDDKDSPAKNLAIHAKEQIVKWYNSDRITYKGAENFGIIQANGNIVNQVLGFKKDAASKESIQDIVIDDLGTVLTVKITPLSGRTFYQIKTLRDKRNSRTATEYIRDFVTRSDIFWGKDEQATGLYRIVPVVKATDEELLENNNETENVDPDRMASKFSAIVEEIRYQTTGIKHTDEVHDISTLIMRELQYQKNHGNESVANELGLLSIKGFVPNDSDSLEKYKVDIYKIAAKHYAQAAEDILKRLEAFSCNGFYYSVDDDALYDALREDPQKANELYHLILEASTFGNQIAPNSNIVYDGEDEEVSKYIDKIQRAIKDVKNNKKIYKAFDNIYNIYLAKEYSTNPLVQLNLISMTDIFGDSDWFAANIGAVTHLNHKQVQIVTKLAMEELEKARLVAIDETADFEEWWNDIEKQLGKEGMKLALSKLIDSEGKFIQPYTKEYIQDREAWREKLAEAAKYGKGSVEYIKVKHQRDKWFIDNVDRQYIKDYYLKKYNNEDFIIKYDINLYSEYLTVEQEYYSLSKFATLTPQQRTRKRILAEKMADLRGDGVLNGFIEKRREINDTYFEHIETEDFRNTLEKHKEILDRYRKNNPHMTLWEMYTNPDEEFAHFRDSYDWIKCNTVYEFSDEAKKEIYGAFSELKTTDDKKKRPIIQIINKFDKDVRLDISNQIIGTLYSLDDSRAIRDIMRRKYSPYGQIDDDGNLVVPSYTENPEAYDSDSNLIKVVPELPVFKEDLFIKYLLDEDERTVEVRTAKRKLYTKINDIIKKGIDDNGDISAELLVKTCTKDELIELGNLYKDLRALSKKANKTYDEDNKKEASKEKKPFTYRTNTPALLKQHKFIVSQNGEIRSILENIFYEKDSDGLIKYKKKMPLGNKFIYGYIDLNRNSSGDYTTEAQKYIDEKKTNARKLLDENIVYETTEYYDKAYEAAQLQGEDYFNEWYDANHVYNPYKHRWEPICIWTVMRPNPAGNLHAKADYVANNDNMERVPKKETVNPVFNPVVGNTYNPEGNYTNNDYKNLTYTEKEILDKLKHIAWQYATSSYQKKFLDSGYAPRVYEKDTDWADAINDVANIFGLGKTSFNDKDWHNDVDFEHDFDINFSMYSLLKAKGYQKPPTLRKQREKESDAKYAEYKEAWKQKVKEINEANLKLDNAVFSKNWKDVYKRLIEGGNDYLARTRMKDLLYLTLQDLRQRKAYLVSNKQGYAGDLVEQRSISTNQDKKYYQVDQNQTADTFQNWIRRYLFDEYKNYTKGTRIADRIQTINSAKFMMFNLMSGINNINVGIVNMIMESSAGDYFTHGTLSKGMANYVRNVPGFVNSFFTGESPNETVAICKMFNVEDYDVTQAGFKDFKAKAVEKANDAAYSFLSSGEHFMRNSAMLAMVDSHRLYQDPVTKKWVVGTEKDYLQGIEVAAIKQVLEQFAIDDSEDATFYQGLKDYFNDIFIPEIRNNKREQLKFDRLQRDIINSFVRSSEFNRVGGSQAVARKKRFIQTYVSVKNDLVKEAKTEFSNFKTVKESIYYDEKQKRERIKPDSNLTLDHVAELINRAKRINQKIHGVYDKLGAAKIERYTLGALIMQYKKHLYPGFMKHWARKGHYDENLRANEYGMFPTLMDLLVQDYRYKSSINDVWNEAAALSDEEESQWAAMNWFHKLVNNALDLGINWQLLPDWQKRNVVRFAGDLGGILISLAIIAAIYAFMDDDDLKNSKAANELLYLADRLYGESTMYGILLSGGLWTEFSNFKEKPIVAMDYIYDAFKMWDYLTDYWSNEDYEPNYKRGTYKGENKMWVVLRRNLPGWRQYSQFKHITSHNNYYKVNENNFAQTLFKNLGKDARKDRENRIDDPMYLFNK